MSLWVFVPCLIAALLAGYWTARGRVAVLAFVLGGALALAASVSFLGRPKPTQWAILERPVKEASVLYFWVEPERQILLLLTWPGQDEPRLYSRPWDEELAKRLREARAEAGKSRRPVVMRRPFDGARLAPGGGGSGRGDQTMDNAGAASRVHVAPPPPLPVKGPS
jgi:hypothetical protein